MTTQAYPPSGPSYDAGFRAGCARLKAEMAGPVRTMLSDLEQAASLTGNVVAALTHLLQDLESGAV